MSERRIVITGASRGIGLAMAKNLIGQGHAVYGAVRNPGGAEDLKAAGPAGILKLDISDQGSIESFGEHLRAETDALDILVNNAGITSGDLGANMMECGPFQVDPTVVLKEIEVNALGPMMVTRQAIPLLEAGDNPVVLNTSSQMGSMVVGGAMAFDIAYNMSKAAVNMLTVGSASQNQNVTFVALHPGWVQTDMGGAQAELTPEAAAGSIVENLLKLSKEDSGRFIRWDGTDHPW